MMQKRVGEINERDVLAPFVQNREDYRGARCPSTWEKRERRRYGHRRRSWQPLFWTANRGM